MRTINDVEKDLNETIQSKILLNKEEYEIKLKFIQFIKSFCSVNLTVNGLSYLNNGTEDHIACTIIREEKQIKNKLMLNIS